MAATSFLRVPRGYRRPRREIYGNLSSAAASQPASHRLMAHAFWKTKKSARAAIFIRSFNGERGGRPTFQPLVSTLTLLFRPLPSFLLSFSSDLTEPPEPKVIMQYQDDFVGSFRSYFSRFCRRLLARQQSPLFMRAACLAYDTACRLTCEVRSHAPRSDGQRGRG